MTYANALLEVKHRMALYLDDNVVKTIYTKREIELFETVIRALEKCDSLEKMNMNREEE